MYEGVTPRQVLRITQEAASVDGKWIQSLPHYLRNGDVKIFQMVGYTSPFIGGVPGFFLQLIETKGFLFKRVKLLACNC